MIIKTVNISKPQKHNDKERKADKAFINIKGNSMETENTFIKLTESAKGRVKVRLQKNNLAKKNKEKFYGKVERNTYSVENILNLLSEKIPGIDIGTAVTVLNAYAEIIEQIIEDGNAVKFGRLGTFYIATKGSVEKEDEKPELTVKFSVSKELKESVNNVEIVSSEYKSPEGSIESITDVSTGKKDGNIKEGSSVILKGSKLKVGGDKGGVYFAPVSEKGNVKDENEWIKVDSALVYNTPTKLLFTVPPALNEGNYRIIVRTQLATRTKYIRKEFFDTVSEEIRFQRKA